MILRFFILCITLYTSCVIFSKEKYNCVKDADFAIILGRNELVKKCGSFLKNVELKSDKINDSVWLISQIREKSGFIISPSGDTVGIRIVNGGESYVTLKEHDCSIIECECIK